MALSLKIEIGEMIMLMAFNIGGDIRNGVLTQKNSIFMCIKGKEATDKIMMNCLLLLYY